jgi:hypothetical protein
LSGVGDPGRELARTEAFLAPDIEGQLRLSFSLRGREKSNHAAEVIVMAVAQYHRVELGWIDTEDLEIVEKCRRGITEVDQNTSRLITALRFEVHRQAEFAQQHLLGWPFRHGKDRPLN